MFALFLVSLASASPLASLKGLLPTSRAPGELTVEVTGEDGALDPGDRAHVTLTDGGEPLAGLFAAGDALLVSLESGASRRWSYGLDATASMAAAASVTLPLVPEADEPYPGEEPQDGVRTVVDHLFDVGDPGQDLVVTVSVYDDRRDQWVALARAPIRWNLDRVAIGALQDEQEARFHDAIAAAIAWPTAASSDPTARKIASGLLSKSVPSGARVLGWNLGGTGWFLVRNVYGVVIQDQWDVNIGYQLGDACYLGEVQLVRDYVGTRPGAPRITGTSPTTALPILCEVIGK